MDIKGKLKVISKKIDIRNAPVLYHGILLVSILILVGGLLFKDFDTRQLDWVPSLLACVAMYLLGYKTIYYWHISVLVSTLWAVISFKDGYYLAMGFQLSICVLSVYGLISWLAKFDENKKKMHNTIGIIFTIFVLFLCFLKTDFGVWLSYFEFVGVCFLTLAVYLTSKQKSYVFYVWILADSIFSVFNFSAGYIGHFCAEMVIMMLSVRALLKWKKEERVLIEEA